MSCHLQSLPHWGRFEVQKHCNQCNISFDCQTSFGANGTVAAFGGVTRGYINADVDIAGFGTVLAFFLPSAISLLISLILILSHLVGKRKRKEKGLKRFVPRSGSRFPSKKHSRFSERAYSCLESTLRAISDIQVLLALALAISLIVFGSCRKLQYHFNVGINLLLLTCANYLQTLGLVRHYWRSWPAGIAALIRLLAVLGIHFFLGWILAIQNGASFPDSHPYVPERLPVEHRNESVILLKAACFLDPSFQKTVFGPLNTAQRELIGLKKNNGLAVEWILWISLTVATGVVLVIRLLSSFGRLSRRYSEDKPPPANLVNAKAFHFIYWSLIWLLSFAVFCYSAITVMGLRSWVSQSGWLQSGETGNSENDITGFGQTAALVLMAAFVIAALDNVSLTGISTTGKSTTGKQGDKKKGDRKTKSKKGKSAAHYV